MNRLAPSQRYFFIWLSAIVAGLALVYVSLPKFSGLRQSLGVLHYASLEKVSLALLTLGSSYGLSAATYRALALRPIKYGNTVLVELAGLLVNRVLPAGVGGLTLNYRYLRKAGHNQGAAGAVILLNNLLGFLGHSLIALSLLSAVSWPALYLHVSRLVAAAAILLIITVAVVSVILRKRIATVLQNLRRQMWQAVYLYRTRPLKLVSALGCSIGMTAATVLCLYYCAQAVGVTMSLVQVFVVFTTSVAAGTATPTPGGIGAVEAGLLAGFVGFKIPFASALAAVLLYRLLSFWLGLLIGGGALFAVRRRHLV